MSCKHCLPENRHHWVVACHSIATLPDVKPMFCPYCGVSLAAPPLAWTREPSVAGWYWIRWHGDQWIEGIVKHDLDRGFYTTETQYPGALYYGPLDIPQPPAPPTEEGAT